MIFDRIPIGRQRRVVLGGFVDTINKTKNVAIERSQPASREGQAGQRQLLYATSFSHSDSLIQHDDAETFLQLLSGLPLPKTRLLGMSAFFRLLSAKMSLADEVKTALLTYFGAIVFIQEFPSVQKRSSSYKLQCDLLGLFLQGELSATRLMELARPLKRNDFRVDRSQVMIIEQCLGQRLAAKPAGGPGVALLVEPLLTTVINQKNIISQLVVDKVCHEWVTEQFYEAFVDSIRICHLPSLDQRAELDGYLEQATASCMSKPAFLLLCSAAHVSPDELEAEAELIELLFFCMRLANDIFSMEREKQEGEAEFRRNIVSILSRLDLPEQTARSIAVETYNLALSHYQKRKEAKDIEPNRDLFTFLEFMNDAPIFVWDHFSDVNNRHS